MLAEIGVALLLFTLGLDFSFGELRRVWRITFLATPLQITLCAAMGYLISTALGLSTSDGIWIGAAISLSSTMIVLKTLAARNALASKPGRIMLAILIAQDVALVPLLLLAPQLTSESSPDKALENSSSSRRSPSRLALASSLTNWAFHSRSGLSLRACSSVRRISTSRRLAMYQPYETSSPSSSSFPWECSSIPSSSSIASGQFCS
ncbi:hypothetical protein EB061_12270 [bacterium]|nr:hypothetical protein [bacterium]